MNITGLTRIRNEVAIIHETLDHMATFSKNIVVYDDASEDETLAVCTKHASRPKILKGEFWNPDRAAAETQNRAYLLSTAKQMFPDTDWFVYMDADERIEFDWSVLNHIPKGINGVRMQLFDYYITPEDADKHYSQRRWIGPEYRNILMVFRNISGLRYDHPDQRSPFVPGKIVINGFVKHYGKAISVKQWEDTCIYYSRWFPKYAAKWDARKGKAIHTESDFGRPLITWEEKESKGIKLY